eukprot:scaffold4110_cov77-Skeletonema_dohrnii-CCMP3373.AAC.15
MIKSIRALSTVLCSFLLLICRIEVASALVNIHRPRSSTIRYRSNYHRQSIIHPLKASEAATTDTVEEPVVTNINDEIKTNIIKTNITEQSPPQPQAAQPSTTTKEAWKPPSSPQNTQTKIFKIQQPQDLLSFVVADERLSIVKVYASWCKTCKVFDIRYRKLASQLGGGDVQPGPVRFAEMQYDTPANEEMCKLLNATKLPYILIYRGSQGKVADFQCTPAKFQVLVDTVNDLLSDDGNGNGSVVVDSGNSTSAAVGSNVTTSSLDAKQQQQLSKDGDHNTNNEVNALKEQLVLMENEKIEMFELMKAQIEADKEEIAKMINVVKIQKSMIEERDEQIQKLSGEIETRDGELAAMTKNFNNQVKENKQMEQELALGKSQVADMTNRTAEAEKTISALELKAAIREKEAKEKERQTKALWASWERQKIKYEEERNSVRKMAALSVKSIKTKVRVFISRKD